MIVPAHVLRALNEGDVPAVQAYLDEGGNVNAVVAGDNEIFCAGDSLLMAVTQASYGLDFTRRHVALAKLLVQHGADVNHHPNVKDGYTALHCCIDILIHNVDDADRAIMLEILGVLVTAGANANLRNAKRDTPLCMALRSNYWDPGMGTQRSAFESVKLLLRAGASLDACRDSAENDDCTAEEMLRKTRDSLTLTGRATGHPNYADDEYFVACEALVADVRAAGGTWKQYVLHMPKALLRLRSLVARGRARSVKRLRARTPRELELLFAPTFPNELCWRVLEYWNPRA
jgi:hypothetical protein